MSTQKRCSRGSRKNRKSGNCESTTSRKKQTKSNKRCRDGYRKNKKGQCQAHNRPSRKKTKTTSHPKAPSVHHKSPSVHRKPPSVRRKSPSVHRKSPSVRRKSPSVRRKSASVRQTSPVRDFTQRMGMHVQNKKMCCQGSSNSGDSRTAALNTLCFDQDAVPSRAEIKKNYMKCSLQVHPDKNRADPRAKEFFQHVNNASNMLMQDFN